MLLQELPNLGSQKDNSISRWYSTYRWRKCWSDTRWWINISSYDSGSANTYAIALSPAVTAYVAGTRKIYFKAGATSTGASTLNVNGVGVKNIKKKNDQDIAAGDIEANAIIKVIYDGTSFQMLSQLATTQQVE